MSAKGARTTITTRRRSRPKRGDSSPLAEVPWSLSRVVQREVSGLWAMVRCVAGLRVNAPQSAHS